MLSKTEINTGRQVKFDYLKGLFIPIILFVMGLGGTYSKRSEKQLTKNSFKKLMQRGVSL